AAATAVTAPTAATAVTVAPTPRCPARAATAGPPATAALPAPAHPPAAPAATASPAATARPAHSQPAEAGHFEIADHGRRVHRGLGGRGRVVVINHAAGSRPQHPAMCRPPWARWGSVWRGREAPGHHWCGPAESGSQQTGRHG